MFAHFVQSLTADKTTDWLKVKLHKPTAVSLLLGLGLGGLLIALLPPLPFLAMLAIWPLGMAISLIAVPLVLFRLRGQALWDMVIWGQAVGVVAVVLLFVASLL
jgi:hypothetical protein